MEKERKENHNIQIKVIGLSGGVGCGWQGLRFGSCPGILHDSRVENRALIFAAGGAQEVAARVEEADALRGLNKCSPSEP